MTVPLHALPTTRWRGVALCLMSWWCTRQHYARGLPYHHPAWLYQHCCAVRTTCLSLAPRPVCPITDYRTPTDLGMLGHEGPCLMMPADIVVCNCAYSCWWTGVPRATTLPTLDAYAALRTPTATPTCPQPAALPCRTVISVRYWCRYCQTVFWRQASVKTPFWWCGY